jgi:hypothetical protein
MPLMLSATLPKRQWKFVAVLSAVVLWSTTPFGPDYGNAIHLATLRAPTCRVATDL